MVQKQDGCQSISLDHFIYKLSRGEICMANFIPPANGASQGNYFEAKTFATSLLASLAGDKKFIFI